MDGLAAGSAGLGGSVIEVDDEDGAEADVGPMEGNGCRNGGLLGAGGKAVGGVLDVAAGDDVAVVEEERCADAEVAVGGVGVIGDSNGSLAEVFDLREGETARGFVLRHGVEAIERVVRWQVCRG